MVEEQVVQQPQNLGGGTLTDRAYCQLREEILSGRLEPSYKLRIKHLKTWCGMGSSPIREALSRLCGDGLVTMEERRGFQVADVSLTELWDITEMRIDLETKALRMAIERGDDNAWEADIVANLHRLSRLDARLEEEQPGDEWERRHSDFHMSLVAACGSRWLLNFRAILFDQSERYRRLSLTKNEGTRDVAGEHKEISEATLDRDAERACKLLAMHIRKTAEIVSNTVALSPNQ